MYELHLAGFMVQSDLDDRLNSSSPLDVADQILGLSTCLGLTEKQMIDPDEIISKLEGRIKSLEDRQGRDAIEGGRKTFQDLGSVSV